MLGGAALLAVFFIARSVGRRLRHHNAALLLLLFLLALRGAEKRAAPVFLADDPILVDPDTLGFPAPSEREISEAYDFLVTSTNWAKARNGPAVNVNTLGDVPSSSWFQDRHYRDRLTVDELRLGPVRGGAPNMSAPWNVAALGGDGKSVGLEIVDADKERFFIKLDPVGYPETSTGAEIISTRILHAIGYNVPQNTLIYFRPDQLQPGTERITRRGIEAVLAGAHRREDGRYRAVASRFIDGRPIGPFRLYGTREDDANDIFPHELRRELRGLRVISAWINHVDMRAENTLSTVISTENGTFARHFLIDFGTTLGGSSLGLQRRWAGHEYWMDIPARLRRGISLGLLDSDWERIPDPSIPGAGRFQAGLFDPAEWVPFQPNPAFRRMDAADAFWAAARIACWTREDVEAVVESGDFSDPRAARHLTAVLMERRSKILDAYLNYGGGLDRFRVEGDSLFFEDLLATRVPSIGVVLRTVRWRHETGSSGRRRFGGDSVRLPIHQGGLLEAEIETPGYGTTRVYLAGRDVVGVERCVAGDACTPLVDAQTVRRRIFAEGP